MTDDDLRGEVLRRYYAVGEFPLPLEEARALNEELAALEGKTAPTRAARLLFDAERYEEAARRMRQMVPSGDIRAEALEHDAKEYERQAARLRALAAKEGA